MHDIVSKLRNVVAVAEGGQIGIYQGGQQGIALKSDGTAVRWTSNDFDVDTLPDTWSGLQTVAAGTNHLLGLKNDGTVIEFFSITSRQVPIPPGLTDVVSIAVGNNHSLALRRDGSVVAWGDNTYGQVTVPSGLKARAIFAGGNQSWVLKDTTSVAIRLRPASLQESEFNSGVVLVRNTSGQILWRGYLTRLSDAARVQPEHKILLIQQLATGRVFRVAGIR
jgi:hypothetical protein